MVEYMSYYCTKCDKEHRESSGIGKSHIEYMDEPPTVIHVTPDRSSNTGMVGMGTTGLTITGVSGDGELTDLDISLYKGSDDFDYEPPRFTESLLDDIRDHINAFPHTPYNYTQRSIKTTRDEQTRWIGKLKNIIITVD